MQRGLVGEIIGRFERKGFTLRALKLFRPSKELAEEHYKDLSAKPFFTDLVDYITSGPVVAMVRHASQISVPSATLKEILSIASVQAPPVEEAHSCSVINLCCLTRCGRAMV